MIHTKSRKGCQKLFLEATVTSHYNSQWPSDFPCEWADLPQSSNDGCMGADGSPLSFKLIDRVQHTKDIATEAQYLIEGTAYSLINTRP
jgi:hypothetical protein